MEPCVPMIPASEATHLHPVLQRAEHPIRAERYTGEIQGSEERGSDVGEM